MNPLPPKENVKAFYLKSWEMNKVLMTRCVALDLRGMGKIGKTVALFCSAQGQELINAIADSREELKRMGHRKIKTSYFKDDEVAPILDQMKDSFSFWTKQIGRVGVVAVVLDVAAERAMRKLRLKPVQNRFNP